MRACCEGYQPHDGAEISDALLAGKTPTATRKQEEALQHRQDVRAISDAERTRDSPRALPSGSGGIWCR